MLRPTLLCSLTCCIFRFKLQFFSSNIVSPNGSVNAFMSPLPPEKSAVDVLADYYKYLLSCSRASIESSTSDGKSLWKSLRVNGIHFVLPHPNGWDTTQQLLMLKAAFKAKLVKDDPSVHSRLSFVTEGEASLHYVISRGLPLGAVSVSPYNQKQYTSSTQYRRKIVVSSLSMPVEEQLI